MALMKLFWWIPIDDFVVELTYKKENYELNKAIRDANFISMFSKKIV